MRTSGEFEISTIEPDDLGKIVPLVDACYGPKAEPLTWWQWYHFGNPAARTAFFVARSGGRIVGMQPMAMGPAILGNRRVMGGMLSGAMVHQEYRGQGVFRSLVEACCTTAWEQGLAWVATMPNDTSRRAFRAMGWNDPGDRALLVKPVLLRHRDRPFGHHVVDEVDRYPEALDKVLQSHELPSGCAAFDRNLQWLNWRFGGNPLRAYHRLLCRQDEAPVGYAVTTTARIRGVRIGYVMDFWAANDKAALALGSAATWSLGRDGARLAVAVVSSPTSIEQFRLFGFIAWPKRLSPKRFHFAFVANPAADHGAEIPVDISRWHLSLGDWDGL